MGGVGATSCAPAAAAAASRIDDSNALLSQRAMRFVLPSSGMFAGRRPMKSPHRRLRESGFFIPVNAAVRPCPMTSTRIIHYIPDVLHCDIGHPELRLFAWLRRGAGGR